MSVIMITGADGYLGSLIALRFLQQTQAELIFWMRADSDQEQQRKRDLVQDLITTYPARIRVVFGNLIQTSPFIEIDATQITHIFHCGAVTNFNVDRQTANQINRDGTRKLLEFASNCARLRHFGLLSTVYASGLQSGQIDEVVMNVDGPFANHYERSKCEAEQILLDEYPDLPYAIYRLATVIAHDRSGEVRQYNVFHNTLRLFYHGLLTLVPGLATTPIYFISGEFAQNAVFTLAQYCIDNDENGKIFHVSHAQHESITLGELIQIMYQCFGSDEHFAARRILPPLFVSEDSFATIALTYQGGLGGAVVRQAVDSIRPFAPQMYIKKSISNGNLQAVLAGYKPEPIVTLLTATMQHLLQSKWGRVCLPS